MLDGELRWAGLQRVAARADAVAESVSLNGLYVNHIRLWWLWITLEMNNENVLGQLLMARGWFQVAIIEASKVSYVTASYNMSKMEAVAMAWFMLIYVIFFPPYTLDKRLTYW